MPYSHGKVLFCLYDHRNILIYYRIYKNDWLHDWDVLNDQKIIQMFQIIT